MKQFLTGATTILLILAKSFTTHNSKAHTHVIQSRLLRPHSITATTATGNAGLQPIFPRPPDNLRIREVASPGNTLQRSRR